MTTKLPFTHPVPIVLIGSKVDGRANYCTVGDVAIAGLNPGLMMISLHEHHYTTKGIDETGYFSINTPELDQLSKVDYCGMISGRNVNKEKVIPTAYYEEIPYGVDMALVTLCKVVHRVLIKQRCLFIGQVIHQVAKPAYLKDGQIQYDKLHPILYGLDNHYYALGEKIGKGYHEGKNYIIKERAHD